MADAPDPANNLPAGYVPPRVWEWQPGNGGQFASINRPVSGPTHDMELPVGEHPLQLYSQGTPNGQKVTILLEELLAAGHAVVGSSEIDIAVRRVRGELLWLEARASRVGADLCLKPSGGRPPKHRAPASIRRYGRRIGHPLDHGKPEVRRLWRRD